MVPLEEFVLGNWGKIDIHQYHIHTEYTLRLGVYLDIV